MSSFEGFEGYEPSLRRLAQLAGSRPTLMSSLMLLYKEQEDMDDEQLAEYLACDPEALPRLALCRRPRDAPHFRGDIETISDYIGADRLKLARMIRAAEAAEALRHAPGRARSASMLMAARDHEDIEETPAQAEADSESGYDLQLTDDSDDSR